MAWGGAISDYTTALRAAHRSAGTIRLHQHYLRHLRGFVCSPWAATSRHLEAALGVEHWAAETRKSARSVYVRFYRWGHGAGFIETDPAAALPPITVPPGAPRPAPEWVLSQALAKADHRTRLMLLLAAYAGLRCSEIARVHTRDLVGEILYVHGKGGRVRMVPVQHPELLAALRGRKGWLFPGRREHLRPGTVTAILSAALPPGWTGHTLRHRFATRAYAGTRDLLAVSAVLGHSRPETTQRYVQMPTDALHAAIAAAA